MLSRASDLGLPADRPRLATAAYALAAGGWPVLPLHTASADGCSCRRADCPGPAKHPRTRRGLYDATTNLAQVTRWWRQWPSANIGLRTGELIVLDVDGENGRSTLAELEDQHAPLPTTLTAVTARGQHWFFRAAGARVPCSVGLLGPGVDIRADGGYVVVAPSVHATGHRYHWLTHVPPVPLTDWLRERLVPAPAPTSAPLSALTLTPSGDRRQRYALAALDDEVRSIASAPLGTRNDTLNRSAFKLGQLAGADLIEHDALIEPLLAAARQSGLSETEALDTITRAVAAGIRSPRFPSVT